MENKFGRTEGFFDLVAVTFLEGRRRRPFDLIRNPITTKEKRRSPIFGSVSPMPETLAK
jgi:hypothetical protein